MMTVYLLYLLIILICLLFIKIEYVRMHNEMNGGLCYRTILNGITNILNASMILPRDDDHTYQFYDDYSEDDEEYITYEQALIIAGKEAVSLSFILSHGTFFLQLIKCRECVGFWTIGTKDNCHSG